MTGLIYVGIIAVWAVVLVPAWLRRHDHLDSERSVDRFTRSLQALAQRDSLLGIPLPRPDSAPSPGAAVQPDAAEVTRVTRPDLSAATSAATSRVSGLVQKAGSRAGAAGAAARRRVVLGVLTAGLLVVAGFVAGGVLLPVALIIPSGLIVAFLAVARHQVRVAQRNRLANSPHATVTAPVRTPAEVRTETMRVGATWEARPTTLPTYVTAPRAAEFPRVIDTATPGAWTAAAMLERAQQQKAHAERMAAAKAEAIARAKAEQAAAEARSRDEAYLEAQTAWSAQDATAPMFRPRAVNE